MVDQCSTKYCRNEVDLIYLGQALCQACYERICDEEDLKISNNC